MKAKLVNESINTQVPNSVMNIILDVAEMVRSILDLDVPPIEDIRYNNRFHRYEGILSGTGELTMDDMQLIRDVIHEEFPRYEESIQLQYDRNTDGLIISLAA
jgi:hypothetical protein